MEKVQFQLEATLPELKDLEEKGLFSKSELKQITKRRTRFETALIKRVAKKEDFFEYAEYEIGLEKLRRVRWKRLNLDKNAPQRTISCYSIPRRVIYILKRATQKFSYDVGAWLAYVDYARSEKMTKVVVNGLTSALQLHPQSAILYILLSHHYLHPNHAPPIRTSSFSIPSKAPTFSIEGVPSARTTLLLGLRMLPSNQDLWREYIKLEIGWVEALRRRWKALGLQAETTPRGLADVAEGDVDMDGDVQRGLPAPTTEEDELDLGQNAFGSSGEPGRRAIVRGDLVIAVLRSSFSRPTMKESVDWHLSLLRLLRTYPTGLRTTLLEEIYKSLSMITECSAQRLVLTKGLYDRAYRSDEVLSRLDDERGFKLEVGEDEVVLEGQELVKELGKIVSAMQGTPERLSEKEIEWNEEAGSWLIKWAGRVDDNEALRTFLLAALAPRTKRCSHPTENLLFAHLNYLATLPPSSPSYQSLDSQLRLTEKCTSIHPSSSRLWHRRLSILQEIAEPAVVGSIFVQAMDAVGAHDGASAVWLAAMEWFDRHLPSRSTIGGDIQPHWQQTLKAARKHTQGTKYSREQSEGLYATLLFKWLDGVTHHNLTDQEVNEILSKVLSDEMNAPYDFYEPAFNLIASLGTSRHLNRLREGWRCKIRTHEERATVALTWADWSLNNGHARNAWDVIEESKRDIEGDSIVRQASQLEDERAKQKAVQRLDDGWKEMLRDVDSRKKEVRDDEMDEDDDDDDDEDEQRDIWLTL